MSQTVFLQYQFILLYCIRQIELQFSRATAMKWCQHSKLLLTFEELLIEAHISKTGEKV